MLRAKVASALEGLSRNPGLAPDKFAWQTPACRVVWEPVLREIWLVFQINGLILVYLACSLIRDDYTIRDLRTTVINITEHFCTYLLLGIDRDVCWEAEIPDSTARSHGCRNPYTIGILYRQSQLLITNLWISIHSKNLQEMAFYTANKILGD